MNHVFVGERFLLWFQLDDSCSCDEGSAVLLSELTFTLCVGAGQTAQSAVKAHITVSSGDTTTREAGWHYNQVMQVEDYRNPCLSDVNDMQLSSVSPQMNLLFDTWLFFPIICETVNFMENHEVLVNKHILGKSHDAALHYQGVLFNWHVMCLSSYNSMVLVWFYCVILNDS